MTGFSSFEAKKDGIVVTCEIKSLNGRYLDIKCRLPRTHSNRELDIREMVKNYITRGTVNVNINIEMLDSAMPFEINMDAAQQCFKQIQKMKTQLKIRDAVKIEHVLHFATNLMEKKEDETSDEEWKLIQNATREALKSLNKMRRQEGQQIAKDMTNRIKNITKKIEEIETLGLKRVPDERERLRQRVAQLFESDEIDEHRLQMELVLLADKLDISEECVRLRSHIKFFNEAFKSREPIGRKINFLLQEMHREINTIGSKVDDAAISQLVVEVKEEQEKIREQVQNIE